MKRRCLRSSCISTDMLVSSFLLFPFLVEIECQATRYLMNVLN
jgi:hypothetical protein